MNIREINTLNMKNELSKYIITQVMQNDPEAYTRFRKMLPINPTAGDKDIFHCLIKEGA